jgi:hypothetical protein
MASPEPSSPLKRMASETSELEAPASKRLRGNLLRYHSFQPYQETADQDSALLPQPAIDQLLSRSISLVLSHDGMEMADPVALESFRAQVEECGLFSRPPGL